MPSHPVDRKLAAILSADAVGYSRLMAEDEEGTIHTLTAYRDQIATLVLEHRGRVVDTPGDNLLAEFPTALDAVQGAVEIQRVIGARNADLPAERRMEFRIGVHLGDISVDGNRVYGDGINVAARLEGLAQPGGVCISDMVYNQVETKLSVDLQDLGEQTLKNIARPVHVYGMKFSLPEAADEHVGNQLPGMNELTVPGFGSHPAIAVLPLDNLSGEPEQEYFVDGIAEDLITRLSDWKHFPVIARNSSFVYKGKAVNVKQVSRELGVRYVVEGSVRKAGERVRICMQLIDARTSHHIWAERYDRELQDVFAVQDEITEAIAASMYPSLEQFEWERAARRAPENLDAWDYTQRGMWHLLMGTREEEVKARSFFEQAIELDPECSRAFAGLAWAHFVDLRSQWTDSPADSVAAVERNAMRSVMLDRTNALGHLALAHAHNFRGRSGESIEAAELAVRLNPSFAFAHLLLGVFLARDGRTDEAIETLERAMRLSPRDPQLGNYLYGMGVAHFAAGRYESAGKWAQRSLQQRSDSIPSHALLASSLAQHGDLARARSTVQDILRLNPKFSLAGLQFILSGAAPDYVERYLGGLRKAGLEE